MSSQRSILLIEDCQGDIDLLKSAFDDCGYEGKIHSISDGEDAFSYLMPAKMVDAPDMPCLIILDINLPKISGIELLDALSRTHHTKSVPVVVMTSSERPEDIARCYEHHASAYFVKPTSYVALLEVVGSIKRTWLELARLPRV